MTAAARAPRPAAAPAVVIDDPHDAAMRQELADMSRRPGVGYRPGDPDDLRDGLLLAHREAGRLRRLAAFEADPALAIEGWRIATMIRSEGADAVLHRDGLIRPLGWSRVPRVVRDLARQRRDALAAWLRLEAATAAPLELRRHARPPHGAEEALIEHHAWCVCCGLPPLGTVAVWHAEHGSREWRCDTCTAPPDDDRTIYVYGHASPLPDLPAAAQRAASAGDPHAR